MYIFKLIQILLMIKINNNADRDMEYNDNCILYNSMITVYNA